MTAPAIVAWDGAHDTIAEGNSIANCSTGIAFGLLDRSGTALQAGVARDNSASRTKSGAPVTQVNTRVASGSGSDHRGGIIRNNMISRTNAQSGGQGIVVADSANTQVLNNTVFLSQTYGTPIEYQFAGAHDVVVVNNLLDGVVWARDGATGVEDHNSSGATADLFTDAANGDLHLSPTASSAIDRGITVPNVLDDWDGQPRPNGSAYDIGADEYTAIKAERQRQREGAFSEGTRHQCQRRRPGRCDDLSVRIAVAIDRHRSERQLHLLDRGLGRRLHGDGELVRATRSPRAAFTTDT